MNKEKINPKEIIGIAYQYCSFNTFKSILENQEIWISDINKMNDFEEDITLTKMLENLLKYVIDNYPESEDKTLEKEINKLKKEIEEKKINNTLKNKLLSEISKFYSNKNFKVKKELFDKLLSDKYLKKGKSPKKFISCFSSCGDILSQWRAYADDGQGFSIGFKKIELERVIKKIENKDIKVTLKNIEYLKRKIDTEEDFKNNYKKVSNLPIINIFEDLSNDKSFYDKIDFKENISLYFHEVISNFLTIYYNDISKILNKENLRKYQEQSAIQSCFYKNYYFNEEKEYRILVVDFSEDNINDNNLSQTSSEVNLSQILYREKNNSLVQYRKIKFSKKIFKEMIAEIYIGAKNKITIEEVKELLTYYGVYSKNISIKKSEASYR